MHFCVGLQPLLLSEIKVLSNSSETETSELRLEYNKAVISMNASSVNERNLWLKKIMEAKKELAAGEKTQQEQQEISKFALILKKCNYSETFDVNFTMSLSFIKLYFFWCVSDVYCPLQSLKSLTDTCIKS